MMRQLALKPDFVRTAQRFEAWWRRDVIDRPPVTLRVRPRRPWQGPRPYEGTPRQRWLDVEYQVEYAEAVMAQRDYVGDAFPAFVPHVGPELAATLLGGELAFDEATSWSEPIVAGIDGWDRLVGRPLDFDNPYWQAVERMTELALQRSAGRYLVGVTDLHNNYDTMAALRGPMGLCMDLADDPQRMRRVSGDVRRAFTTAFDRLWQRIAAAGMGCTTWCPLYHEGPCYLPSCDFWCMVGSETARDLILPDVRVEMASLERSLFHLDGPDALRHLDLLLAMPQLDAVQWVYGAGAGPATRWTHVYRRILAAGKAVQVIAAPQDGLALLEALGPKGVWLTIDEPFDDVEAAQRFLTEVERRTIRRSRSASSDSSATLMRAAP
ncbi:MAG: hypothetical protein ACODAQ_02630 [Phycisphaeraceae bacterium]